MEMSVRTTNLRWAIGAFTITVLGITTLLLARGIPSVQAEPRLGHIFFGNVTVGGNRASSGVEIQARINGVNFAFSNQGDNVPRTDSDGKYGTSETFRVLADDPATTAKEGGAHGEIIQFFVGGDNAT